MKNIILIACLSFISILNAHSRNLSLKQDSDSLYAANVGKILFLPSFKNLNQITKNDVISRYTFTPKSDLSFIAFFEKPLTAYTSSLSLDVKRDSLFKISNYQFAVWVDDKEIYRSNLLPGAPQRKVQDTALILNRPLIDNKNGQGSWSESFWNRFMNNGGENALQDGLHHLRLEIRPYVNRQNQIKTGPVMASGELILQVSRHPVIDIRHIALNAPKPYDGFPVSSKKFDTAKIKQLKGLIDEGIFKRINSIVVINGGKLQIEEYFNGEDRNTLHDPRSVGKSFVSTLMGIAIGNKIIENEDQKLSTFYDFKNNQYANDKGEATIKELLTMSSGFNGNDDDPESPGNEEKMYPINNWTEFVLNLPYDPALKNRWHYFTAGTVLLGDLLNRSVPGGLEKFADEKLFSSLNIKNYRWEYTPQQVPNTAGGIRMNALDFAKYGQLYKNNGLWNKKRIIPESWVKKTLTRQVMIPERKEEYYSYLFWNKKFNAKGRGVEAFYCAGNGGNYIIILKDLPVVVVITASAYGQTYAHTQVTEIIENYILPAIL
ncbi:CubicO group peptidase (beta-lactamase class C family) [Chryseobacterium sp. SORGH_AS 447]|uniref:serine hydrolase domain-containing protein n=1 Tax=Chryseobacterium sp. SORGH_AS_0447 TaxID=3041769 RepID=UPI00277E5CF8|nr:serine hydrolase [Chryseobacterium sp. SORGH_AS_0447]MDQ1161377.1 CubicO group peptidase (beta-lactamase class C family) [Chryseobacterium sp. SORGH_AS_0447]